MSEPKIDFGPDDEGKPNAWSGHAHSHWAEKAMNPDHPLPLRVYFAALSRRRIGGHAPFSGGELAEALISPGAKIPSRQRVAEAIRQCVKWGYLAVGSNALCLIVPLADVQGGRDVYRCRRGHNVRELQAHKAACECPRCLKVSVRDRTHDDEVSVSKQDTSTPSVRVGTDTLSVRPLFSLATDAPASDPSDSGEATA